MEITAMDFSHDTSVVSRKQFEDHITLYACVIIEPTLQSTRLIPEHTSVFFLS
jgi:hypothetical protein